MLPSASQPAFCSFERCLRDTTVSVICHVFAAGSLELLRLLFPVTELAWKVLPQSTSLLSLNSVSVVLGWKIDDLIAI